MIKGFVLRETTLKRGPTERKSKVRIAKAILKSGHLVPSRLKASLAVRSSDQLTCHSFFFACSAKENRMRYLIPEIISK